MSMRLLTALFRDLDSTTSTNAKVSYLASYFEKAEDRDKVWTIALLSHRRPPRAVNYRLLGEWAAENAGLPLWLFEESYHIVGDYAETIALLIPERSDAGSPRSLSEYMELMIALKPLEEEVKKQEILSAWDELRGTEIFIFNKLITGGLRVGVSQKLMVRALSKHTGKDENHIALRLMGDWDPSTITFEELVLSENAEDDLSRPYPFFLAYALDTEPDELGDVNEWQIERKWDGIRGQVIVRGGKHYVWSRGEELVTDKYPELDGLAERIPDGTVIDGEILAYRDGQPLPFQLLQKRIGRKNVGKKLMADVPVRVVMYDVMEWGGKDIREEPLTERRAILNRIAEEYDVQDMLIASPVLDGADWQAMRDHRAMSRETRCEGLMIKRRSSTYQTGRKRGDWWKWKIDPFSVDAVMIYAQRGHGRRANLFTDFTFAVWDGERLVPFAKAYSGLKNEEFEEITRWVRRNTIERFGPVSSVPATHVFELYFEGIGHSSRHKSGIAVRFPRIHRWRRDKKPEDADTLATLKALIPD